MRRLKWYVNSINFARKNHQNFSPDFWIYHQVIKLTYHFFELCNFWGFFAIWKKIGWKMICQFYQFSHKNPKNDMSILSLLVTFSLFHWNDMSNLSLGDRFDISFCHFYNGSKTIIYHFVIEPTYHFHEKEWNHEFVILKKFIKEILFLK